MLQWVGCTGVRGCSRFAWNIVLEKSIYLVNNPELINSGPRSLCPIVFYATRCPSCSTLRNSIAAPSPLFQNTMNLNEL